MAESDVILSEIRTLKEFFEKGFKDNKEEHENMKKTLKDAYDEHETRIRKIEDWRLVFVAKYTVYSAIALFFGSIISTIGVQFVSKLIK